MEKNRTPKALPPGPAPAVQALTRLTQALMAIAEKETQALLRNDFLAFAVLQHEKEKAGLRYAEASGEFRARIEEFRGMDKVLLARLEKLQADLGDKFRGNQNLLGRLYESARSSVQDGLTSFSESDPDARIRFEAKETSPGEGALA